MKGKMRHRFAFCDKIFICELQIKASRNNQTRKQQEQIAECHRSETVLPTMRQETNETLRVPIKTISIH